VEYPIEHEGKQIGKFRLTPLPGCAKVGVSHHLEIYESFRGRGLGHKAQKARLDLAKSLGFRVLLATTRDTNAPQEHILPAAGWKRVTFYEEDGFVVHLWSKNLADPYEEADFFQGGCR
jgi:GNAT superfamily N-acetyltransferase